MSAQDVRQEIDRALGTVDEVMQRTVVSLSPDEAIAEAAMDLESLSRRCEVVGQDTKSLRRIVASSTGMSSSPRGSHGCERRAPRGTGAGPDRCYPAPKWHRRTRRMSETDF
jgi:hypothetical protein